MTASIDTPAQLTWKPCSIHRDAIGGSVVVGDTRWAGTFGVAADFVARTHCSVEVITKEDIQVCHCDIATCTLARSTCE
jgi:hypothetical protein